MESQKVPWPNPLLIRNVLSLVLRNLPSDDVKVCLDVCKLWKEEGTSTLKERISANLVRIEDIYYLLEKMDRMPKNQSYKVSEICINSPHFPLGDPLFLSFLWKIAPQLSTFKIPFACGTKEDCDAVLRILWERGSALRKLDLDVVKIVLPYLREYVKFFPVRDESTGEILVFPKGRKLDVNNYCSFPTLEDMSSLLSTVCRTFPNLEELFMFSLRKEKPSNFDNIRMPSLKSFRLVMPNANVPDHNIFGLGDVGVKCLIALQPKLELFHLYGLNPKCKNLKEFLKTQAESLKELLLIQRKPYERGDKKTVYYSDETLPTLFPILLPKLERLQVSRSFVVDLNQVFESIPNARNVFLDFHRGCAVWTAAMPENLSVPASLKTLEVNWIDVNAWKKLVPSFRHITDLQLLECNDDILLVVFTELGASLTKLSVSEMTFAGEMSDSGFSGITREDLEDLGTTWKKWSRNRESFTRRVDVKRRNSSIADMENLESLFVRFMRPCSIKYMNFWPLWKLKKLKSLQTLGVSVNCRMTASMQKVCRLKCSGPIKSKSASINEEAGLSSEDGYYIFEK